jgi:hypothetical protein
MKRDLWNIVTLCVMQLFATAVAHAQAPDFTHWSQKQCRKIVADHSHFLQQTFKSALTHTYRSTPSLSAIWLTENSIKALARLQQLQENGTESDALVLYATLKAQTRDQYGFMISLNRQLLKPLDVFDLLQGNLDPDMSLTNKKQPGRSSRASQWPPRKILPNTLRIAGFSETVVVSFDKTNAKGQELITSIDDEIQLSIPVSGHGTFVTTFRLNKLVASPGDL